jgi:hypothetical protein
MKELRCKAFDPQSASLDAVNCCQPSKQINAIKQTAIVLIQGLVSTFNGGGDGSGRFSI